MMKILASILLFLCFLPSLCAAEDAYTQISQAEAMDMMARDDGHVVVDVRRQDEYDAGHIPGAVLIPNEDIVDQPPEALPDKDQIILIYCRSGNRSKQAAEKLARMGYTRVFEFGGIITWPGEIVTTEQEKQNALRMRVTDGEHTVIYQLNDTPSALSLYSMLPLEAEVENFGRNEKIFYPPEAIDTADGLEGGGKAGMLALFSPWGNVVMYYDSFSAYPGLYILGEAVEGADQVQGLQGHIFAEAVR